ncbi:MAG: insulinase family protein [Treponema sp.]
MSKNKNTIAKSYKGFDLISVTQVPDNGSEGVYLRHRKTGLEVFHLLNDDAENLFAFAFRTLIKNAVGAAHILEHSVFCGSEKFPLKEPFTNMMNQSVHTFLNAMTYPDKTVYPASSTVKADYFNLMDVYGDAVFFPLLKKEAFIQEAHRLELDDAGNFSIQGVVYNEMKGNYSSFESVAADVQFRSLFPGTNYAFDSGGDPESIPHFSYEDFKAFHKKYYVPENCLVFLYGNIPTEEQLDFLQKNVLDRLETRLGQSACSQSDAFTIEECEKMETPQDFTESVKISETAPSSGATGATVSVNWLCGQTKDLDALLECSFLSEVLIGHDGSPIAKALTESRLGDDLAPMTGAAAETRFFTFALGLHGVKPKNEEKVYALIFDELERICAEGIDRRDIDAALMTAEFANREIVRSGGPYSLVLLERALAAWNYGAEPASHLLYRAAFEKIREKAETGSEYIVSLIKKYLLENKRRSFVCVTPSHSYIKERNEREVALVKTLSAEADVERVKAELAALHAYQQKKESAADTACIPRLKISDLTLDSGAIKTEIAVLKNGAHEIPLFKNVERTNGIAYLELCIPVDNLPAREYPYLPLFAYCAANAGWNGKNWVQCAAETAVHTGGIEARLVTSGSGQTPHSAKMRKNLEKYQCAGRDYLIFSVRMLAEKTREAAALFSEAVAAFDFTDVQRVKNLCSEAKSALFANVVPRGTHFALTRAQSHYSHSTCVNEIWRGLTQVFAVNSICKEKTEKLAAHFDLIKQELLKAGAILHVTADEKTLESLLPELELLAIKNDLKPPAARIAQSDEDFKKLLLLNKKQSEIPMKEVFTVGSQVGYCASVLPGTFFGAKENAADLVLAHRLSGTYLWERVRTTGGAYGSSASSANILGKFLFSSFRDPTPFKTLDIFADCVNDAAASALDSEECENLVIGAYGDEVQPFSPVGRGNAGFMRTLYCISDEDRAAKLRNLLSVTPETLQSAALRIASGIAERHDVVICDKAQAAGTDAIELPV